MPETISRHFLKRRALDRERQEQILLIEDQRGKDPNHRIGIGEAKAMIITERAERGPFRWRVVRLPRPVKARRRSGSNGRGRKR